MEIEIAKYLVNNHESFSGSNSMNWFSEFLDQAFLKIFIAEHKIDNPGISFINEIDYGNLSGVPNPNLTKARDALSIMESLVEIFKSSKFNFSRTVITETGEPLRSESVFIDNKSVPFPKEFWHGFTVQKLFEMKNLTLNENVIIVNLPIEKQLVGGGIEMVPGPEVQLKLIDDNFYNSRKARIDASMDFLKVAATSDAFVQIMSC